MSDNMTWLVRRFHWRKFPSAEPRYVRLPGAFTVAEYDNREDAEADRWRREQAVRERINPFHCGFDLADCTHLPNYAFKDFLLDDSVRPAKYDSYARVNWGKWWDTHSPGWGFDRRGRIWEALDKVRFFEVIGREKDRQLFVSVEGMRDFYDAVTWWYGNWNCPRPEFGCEGGRPERGFRVRADAQACCDLLAEAMYRRRTQPDAGPHTHEERETLPADRVYDVPLDGELSPFQPTVFVVARIGLRELVSPHGFCGWEFDTYQTGEMQLRDPHSDVVTFPAHVRVTRRRLVPEAAFTTREAAEADVLERERAARRWLNPHLIHEFARSDRDRKPAAIWWSANISNAPDAEFEEAWAAFPSHRLFEVVEIAWE